MSTLLHLLIKKEIVSHTGSISHTNVMENYSVLMWKMIWVHQCKWLTSVYFISTSKKKKRSKERLHQIWNDSSSVCAAASYLCVCVPATEGRSQLLHNKKPAAWMIMFILCCEPIAHRSTLHSMNDYLL